MGPMMLSFPYRAACYFVAWVGLIVILALLWGDQTCTQ